MSNFARLLEGYLGVQRFQQIKQRASEKINSKIELTLREDVVVHTQRYEYPFPHNRPTRAIQLLYSDMIRATSTYTESGQPYGLFNVDSISVAGRRGYKFDKMHVASQPGPEKLPTLLMSLIAFANELHPPSHSYPKLFNDFILKLQTVTTIDELKKLSSHPGLKTFGQLGTMVYDAYALIQQKAATDGKVWRNFAKKMGRVDINGGLKGADPCYWHVYNTYKYQYFQSGKGLLYYYTHVLFHANDWVDGQNKDRFNMYSSHIEKIAVSAVQKAIQLGMSEEEAEEWVRVAIESVPSPVYLAKIPLKKLVEDMEARFPDFHIKLHEFLMSENIFVDGEDETIILFPQLYQPPPPPYQPPPPPYQPPPPPYQPPPPPYQPPPPPPPPPYPYPYRNVRHRTK